MVRKEGHLWSHHRQIRRGWGLGGTRRRRKVLGLLGELLAVHMAAEGRMAAAAHTAVEVHTLAAEDIHPVVDSLAEDSLLVACLPACMGVSRSSLHLYTTSR